MEHHEQVDAFTFELDNLVQRFLEEFDVGVHAIVGVLEDKKLDLLIGKEVEFDPNFDDEVGETFDSEDL